MEFTSVRGENEAMRRLLAFVERPADYQSVSLDQQFEADADFVERIAGRTKFWPPRVWFAKKVIADRREQEARELTAAIKLVKPQIERLSAFAKGTLPSQVALSTIQTDLKAARKVLAHKGTWDSRFRLIERLITERQAAEQRALEAVREEARDRYLRRRGDRRMEDRQRSVGSGSGRKGGGKSR